MVHGGACLRPARPALDRIECRDGWVGLKRWEATAVVTMPITRGAPPGGGHELRVLPRKSGKPLWAVLVDGRGDHLHDLDHVLAQELDNERGHPGPVHGNDLPQALLTDAPVRVPGAQAERQQPGVTA